MKIQTNLKAGAMCACPNNCGGGSSPNGSRGQQVSGLSNGQVKDYLDDTAAYNNYLNSGSGSSSVTGWGCYA